VRRIVAFVLAACLGAPAFGAGNAASGKQKSQTCAACHGPDGNSPPSPDFPRLAGQHYDYLLKSLRDYKSGARKNPIMAGQVGNLTPQDIADLAAFYASQKGSLHVIR
jgi:cytochrome c553